MKLSEVCILITDGKHGDCFNQPNSGYYFLSAKDVFDRNLDYSNAREITRDDFLETNKRTRLEPGDILLTNSGTIGRLAIAKNNEKTKRTTFQKSVAILKPNKTIIQPEFLYYLFLYKKPELIELAGGTTQQNLLLGDLKNYNIEFPPLPEQRAIAGVLSALDDKIELNRRMNSTLEQLAQAIFKHWFIDNSENKKWENGILGDDFNLTMGQSPPGSSYNENGEGVPFFQGRADFGSRYPANRVYSTAPTRFARDGDTLVCVRAPVGDINIAIENCAIGRGLAAIRNKTGSRSYTYYLMQYMEPEFKNFEMEGTVFGSINKDSFLSLKIPLPPHELIEQFEDICYPLDQKIELNEKENRTLAELRDTLLPKLMSGHIKISINEEK